MDSEIKSQIDDFFRNRIASCCILVVGDVMLDRYFYGNVDRISPEAPVPVNSIEHKKDTLGGAGSVAHNLVRLGCEVYLAGVIAADHHGRLLQRKLRKLNLSDDGLIDGRDKTTTKIRVLGGHQQMIRLDFEEKVPLSDDTSSNLLCYVDKKIDDGVGAIIISDYGKGVCTKHVCHTIIDRANALNIPVFVDPKGRDWSRYEGAGYATPNVKETSAVVGRSLQNTHDSMKEAASFLRKKFNLQYVMTTRSEHGLSFFGEKEEFHVPTIAQEVFDVSGAGDTVIATFAACIVGGLSHEVAAYAANIAAGIGIGKVGTYAVSREEILNKITQLV